MWFLVAVVALAAAQVNLTAPVQAPALGLQPDSSAVDTGGVVIRTWGLLKETTDAMTSRAQDVLHVRGELSALAADIKTQRQAWSAATLELEQQNRMLTHQVAALEVPDVQKAQATQSQLRMQEHSAQEAITMANNTASRSAIAWKAREAAYRQQIATLYKQLEQAQGDLITSMDAAAKAREESLQATTALQTKVADLQNAVHQIDLHEQALDAQAEHNGTLLQDQNSFLAREYASVTSSIPKVRAAADEMEPVLHKVADAQAQLALVQTEYAKATGACAEQTATLASVLHAERAKVGHRASDVARCGSVRAQYQWLQGMVEQHCPKAV